MADDDLQGPERIKGAYAWRTLIEFVRSVLYFIAMLTHGSRRSGARLVIGSDFPVEGVNPLLGFYAAVTRLDVLGDSPHGKGGWYPEQRLTRHEALRGMTLGASYAAHQEEILGRLYPLAATGSAHRAVPRIVNARKASGHCDIGKGYHGDSPSRYLENQSHCNDS